MRLFNFALHTVATLLKSSMSAVLRSAPSLSPAFYLHFISSNRSSNSNSNILLYLHDRHILQYCKSIFKLKLTKTILFYSKLTKTILFYHIKT